MNFEHTLTILEKIEPQDGFTPSDLLDLPEAVVPILRQMMTRKGKSLADLSNHFQLPESETDQLLGILQSKGLVQQNQKENKVIFTAKLR